MFKTAQARKIDQLWVCLVADVAVFTGLFCSLFFCFSLVFLQFSRVCLLGVCIPLVLSHMAFLRNHMFLFESPRSHPSTS